MYRAIRTSLQFLGAAHNSRTRVLSKLSSAQSSTAQHSIPNYNGFDIEAQNEYRIGGFHPVELGDVLSSRYSVLQKLGYGRYSTVWLVKDNQYCTLKDT